MEGRPATPLRRGHSRLTLDTMTTSLVFIYLIGLAGCLWVSIHMGQKDTNERSTKELVEGDQTFRGLAVMWTSGFAFLCLSILVRG
jgi:hypothetical protein